MAKLGAYMGALHGVEQFESWLGRSVDQVLGFLPGNGWSLNLNAAISSGYYGPPGTKKIVWSLQMYPEDGGVAALREVAAGQHVADHTRWAQQILASRAGNSDPIYIRPNWELGGEWYPWTGDAQQDPQAYRAAFQQFAQAFDNVSARFRIVWDVVGDRGDPTHLWPGDQYVDVIGQDHYWNPQWTSSDPVAAFHAHLNLPHGLNWLAAFAAQHGKPMAIPEFGVPGRTDWAPAPWEDPSNPGSLISVAPGTYDGATFIRLMKSWVNAHNVEFVNYWNEPGPAYDGRLSDGDPAAAAHALRDFFLTSFVGAAVVEGFDREFYLRNNPGVANAGVDPLAHYRQWGWREGRDPNALFDTDGYLAAYPDVAAAAQQGLTNPLEHYMRRGWKEDRDPTRGFDTTSYLVAYPDVANAGLNPLEHYLRFGIHEGRQTFGDANWV